MVHIHAFQAGFLGTLMMSSGYIYIQSNTDNTTSFGPEKIVVLTVCRVTNSDTAHRDELDCDELDHRKL